MYSEEELDSAVAAHVLSAQSADAFRAFVADRRHTTIKDEESFRLLTGFNDIFVVIAIVLLLMSLGGLGGTVASGGGALLVALAAWALAEYFTRRRRMALPSIVLLLAFVGGLFAATLAALGGGNLAPIFASTAAVVAIGVSTLLRAIPGGEHWLLPLMFCAGLLVFGCALRWDLSDRDRRTRRSDVAFWLHLLAAPLLVHPVFGAMQRLDDHALAQTLLVLGVYVALGVVSLAINRRALMVSALSYVLFAFTALLRESGVVSLSFTLTALVIGSALLLLSAFWHPCRTAVLQWLPGARRLG
jgi:hypothetical protein